MGYYGGNDYKDAKFSELVGKTILSATGLEKNCDEVVFTCSDGSKYRMYHWQDCCESVYVEDVVGDVSDIIGYEVLVADETSSSGEDGEWGDSSTWTYYKIDTNRGGITVRWYGSSNGYYSERVDFEKYVGEGD